MAGNEILLLLTALLSAGLVFAAWRLDKERLYGIIFGFLVLISLLGGKIVTFFGHETNTGNIFYASVFLATYFLIERYGKREGIRSIWVGIVGVVMFTLLLQMAVALTGSGSTASLDSALSAALTPSLRIAIASLVAYLLSQTLNVYVYIALKKRYGREKLWLRANAANILAQLLDSLVFFSIAFWSVIPPANITDVILTGFAVKVIFMMAASPLLYLNRVEMEVERDAATLTFR